MQRCICLWHVHSVDSLETGILNRMNFHGVGTECIPLPMWVECFAELPLSLTPKLCLAFTSVSFQWAVPPWSFICYEYSESQLSFSNLWNIYRNQNYIGDNCFGLNCIPLPNVEVLTSNTSECDLKQEQSLCRWSRWDEVLRVGLKPIWLVSLKKGEIWTQREALREWHVETSFHCHKPGSSEDCQWTPRS